MMEPQTTERSGSVLLVSADGPTSRSLLGALQAAMIEVEWARTFDELQLRAARDDVRTPELVFLDLELELADTSEQVVPLVRTSFPRATTIALIAQLTGECAVQLLGQGVASLAKPVCPNALTGLALQLSLGASAPWASRAADGTVRPQGARLETVVDAYASDRVLSKQQRTILGLYLDGRSDKEIAQLRGCSEATVYEHWRRMAKKVGGVHKGDAIADFHRFLASM